MWRTWLEWMKGSEKPHMEKYGEITNGRHWDGSCTFIPLRLRTSEVSGTWVLLHRVYKPQTYTVSFATENGLGPQTFPRTLENTSCVNSSALLWSLKFIWVSLNKHMYEVSLFLTENTVYIYIYITKTCWLILYKFPLLNLRIVRST